MKKTKIFKRKINKKTNLKTLLNGIIQPNSSAIRILYKVYFKTFLRPKAIKILKKVFKEEELKDTYYFSK